MADELVVVHWPGKDTTACPEHLVKLIGLGTVLGIQVAWTRTALDGAECDNCRTERLQRPSSSH